MRPTCPVSTVAAAVTRPSAVAALRRQTAVRSERSRRPENAEVGGRWLLDFGSLLMFVVLKALASSAQNQLPTKLLKPR